MASSSSVISSSTDIPTRLLILSDTHGAPVDTTGCTADVAIHCGDLTEESKLDEFCTSLALLKAVEAPIKLVIAGNHDFTLDDSAFCSKLADLLPTEVDPALVKRTYGDIGEARQLIEDARSDGIIFLDEGNHTIPIPSGAVLNIFASPCTTSTGGWGFGYAPGATHEFSIADGTDIVITHGPPQGVLDFTDNRTRAGCPQLFSAITWAQPKLHCFGHIHEGWGARLITWKDEISENPTHMTSIDNDRSVVIESLQRYRSTKFDSPERRDEKLQGLERIRQEKYWTAQHRKGDGQALTDRQTLFVSAAIEGREENVFQPIWIVDLDLPGSRTGLSS